MELPRAGKSELDKHPSTITDHNVTSVTMNNDNEIRAGFHFAPLLSQIHKRKQVVKSVLSETFSAELLSGAEKS